MAKVRLYATFCHCLHQLVFFGDSNLGKGISAKGVLINAISPCADILRGDQFRKYSKSLSRADLLSLAKNAYLWH
jgi:hypothetical protein